MNKMRINDEVCHAARHFTGGNRKDIEQSFYQADQQSIAGIDRGITFTRIQNELGQMEYSSIKLIVNYTFYIHTEFQYGLLTFVRAEKRIR